MSCVSQVSRDPVQRKSIFNKSLDVNWGLQKSLGIDKMGGGVET